MTIILATGMGMGATIFLACFHRLRADAKKLEARLRSAAAPLAEEGQQAELPFIDLDYAL